MNLSKVSSRYGAPMGRSSDNMANFGSCGKIHLAKVTLDSGGYDKGGAYWGHGETLWKAWDNEIEAFFRASNRDAAKEKILNSSGDPDNCTFYR